MSSMAAANSSSSAVNSSRTRDRGTPASDNVRNPDQLDDSCGVVAAVPRVVACGLGQQTFGVVVAHRPHGDPGVRRELADR